jgi:hypothetical protein
MYIGRSPSSSVNDAQVLVTHTENVATMEQEMGNPARLIRTPDVCCLCHARDGERLPGLVDRWKSYGIAAQVVRIPPRGGESIRDSHPIRSSCHAQAGGFPSTPASRLMRKTGLHMALPTTGETRMTSTTDRVHEGCDRTAHPSTGCTGGRRSSGCPARDGGLL